MEIPAAPTPEAIATKRLPAHIIRAVVGLSAMAFTFNGIVALPLAEATTIGFTVPIFATILGALVLREPTGWHRWGAVIAGFAGVLVPLALERAGADPAVASSVFVTMVTDSMGFLAVLGLASATGIVN